MAIVRPFPGWHYTAQHELDALLAPPYDVIGAQKRVALAARHPHNIVHIMLPQPDFKSGLDPYQHAARLFDTWAGQGVMQQDTTPAFYLLRQTFRRPDGAAAVRTGFAGRLLLAPWGQGILPHERTFPQAKADRLALLQATGVQDSPIFTLYRDPGALVRAVIAEEQSGPATSTYRDDDGVLHELWRADEPRVVNHLIEMMAGRTLYVADGHHRYETALTYRTWRRSQHGNPADRQPYDYCLAYFTAMEDPGAIILPTHRLVVHGRRVDAGRLRAALANDFDVIGCTDDASLAAAMASEPAGEPVFGLLMGDSAPFTLKLRPATRSRLALLGGAYGPAVAELPVTVLQALVLGPHFGISDDPHAQKAQLQFEPDAGVALAHVRSGRAQAALLTTPTSMAQLAAVAEAGDAAPPKATYFYPKLPSGLVLCQV